MEQFIYGVPCERVKELCTAEKDGRCVVLPCKLGDTVYRIILGEIEEYTVRGFAGRKTIETVYLEYRHHGKIYDCSVDIETVFLTREAARAALAKEGNDGN